MDFGKTFETGLEYREFLDKFGTEEQQSRWQAMHESVALTAEQTALLTSFTRDMKVLVLAGTWCGDCVNQCPILDHFAAVTPKIHIRYFDRDESADLAEHLTTCGAARVPSVLFLSEDNFVCGRYGDRTLSKYREMVSSLSGAACATGIAGADGLLPTVTQEWLNEFERIQWMLRTSGRLRKLHDD